MHKDCLLCEQRLKESWGIILTKVSSSLLNLYDFVMHKDCMHCEQRRKESWGIIFMKVSSSLLDLYELPAGVWWSSVLPWWR